jgi:hypothetical protein
MPSFNYGYNGQILMNISVNPNLDSPTVFKQKMEETLYPLVEQYLPYALAITAIALLVKKI